MFSICRYSYFSYSSYLSDALATVFHDAAAPSAPPLDGAPTPALAAPRRVHRSLGDAGSLLVLLCCRRSSRPRARRLLHVTARHRQLIVERGRPRGRPRARRRRGGEKEGKALAGMPRAAVRVGDHGVALARCSCQGAVVQPCAVGAVGAVSAIAATHGRPEAQMGHGVVQGGSRWRRSGGVVTGEAPGKGCSTVDQPRSWKSLPK